jgi:hypothetical protein
MLPFPDNLMIYPHGGVALRSHGTGAKDLTHKAASAGH